MQKKAPATEEIANRELAAAQSMLLTLGLESADLSALRRQGFVVAEPRGPGPPLYKLRFRVNGQQRVKSLGRDPLRAAAIRSALADWQTPHHKKRKSRQLPQRVLQALRSAKQQLEPVLATVGLRFHGFSFRKTHPRKTDVDSHLSTTNS